MVRCPKCGEIHYEYDAFCPKCGTANDSSEQCSGQCGSCPYDDLMGNCTKNAYTYDIRTGGQYPTTVLRDKKGRTVTIEETDKRSRAAAVALALFPTGAVGIHDFYTRRYWQGIIHGLLFSSTFVGLHNESVGFLRYGFLVSWALAAAEGILMLIRVIKADGKGYPFS